MKLTSLFSSRSIRRRVVLAFLAASLLPLAVFAIASVYSTENALEDQARESMRNRAEALRAAMAIRGRTMVDQVVINAEWDAFCTAIDGRDIPWVEDNATTWVVENSGMTGAQALDMAGSVVSAAGDLAGASLADSPVVVAAADRGVNSFDVETVDGELAIVAAGPVVEEIDDDPPQHGVLVFSERISADTLAELASYIGADELTAYDDAGSPIASSAGPDVRDLPIGMPVGEPYSDGRYMVILGNIRDRAGELQAIAAMKVDTAAVAVTSSTLWRLTGYAVLGALAVALIGCVVITKTLGRPLRKLAVAAKAIAAGDTRQRVEIDSNDEFGEVAAAFNTMSDKLDAAFAELRVLSEADPLTGLLNHRTIHRTLERELQRARRYDRPVSVLIIDIDDFKLFNDTYGHPGGDDVLRSVARLLEDQTRGSDLVGRHGGDEFMAVLPETTPAEAVALAEHLRRSLSATSYEASSGERIPVRASFGVAGFPRDGERSEELIAAADANLYVSKHRGGDRVTAGSEGDDAEAAADTAFGMLESLVTAVDNKDRYTRLHSEQVTEHALAVADRLGVDEEGRRALRLAGLLHDVGKIGVPDNILRKPGRLTAEEEAIVRRHSELGATIIVSLPDVERVRAAVISHHERWDGEGFPQGLAGEDIPLFGRILAVADAYCAMTTDRPYRSAYSTSEALAELRAQSGAQFDPAIVEVFLETLGAGVSAASTPARTAPAG